MKLIVETKDAYLIKAILNADNLWDSFSYDGVSFASWVPDLSSIWLIMYEDHNIAGLFKGDRLGNRMLSVHVAILADYRGKDSKDWGKVAAKYVKDHHDITSLIALTPYDGAKKYAERAGFKFVKKLNNSILKNGELLDQYMLEWGL